MAKQEGKERPDLLQELKYKIPDKIYIIAQEFLVIQTKEHGGGSFDFKESTIEIGIRDIETSPDYTFSILVHEISEVIHCFLNTRYHSYGSITDYKFVMDHKEFENHGMILAGILHNQILL